MPSNPKGKILVIRGGAIGDFILTLPVFAALRAQFPQTHLEVLGYPHIAQLALAGGLVDAVHPIEARALAGFFARNGQLDEGLADYFSEFAIIVSYLYDPDEIFQTNVARCSPGQFIMGPHRADDQGGVHAAQVYLKPLERLAIFEADAVPRLALGDHDCDGDDLPLDSDERERVPTLALHPGSGSERKNWPEAKWAELLRHLIGSTGLHLLVVGGEAEGEKLERLTLPLPKGRCTVARSLPLAELAGRLRGCVGFAGHDSGITHLAAAVGLPCLVLWGDTAETVWRPQGDRLMMVRERRGLVALGSDCVFRELKGLLNL